MAKKVRKRPGEDEPSKIFEFPTFDDVGFVSHEFELTFATALGGLFAVIEGLISWAFSVAGLPWYAAAIVAPALIIASPFLILRIRAQARDYTKGDWAGLIVIQLFGWLALWFLFLNLSPHAF
ncbi:MAG: PIN domain-containing protein [Thermoplasmata archaeon]